MAKRKHAAKMYEAAEHWRDNCLVKDGSAFGDKALWSRENFEADFEKRFVDFLVPSADESTSHVEVRTPALVQWKEFLRIAGASAEIFQLMAEVVWAMGLVDSHSKPSTKKRHIQTMAKMSGAQLPEDHKFLQDEYMKGTAKLGAGFASASWFERIMLILSVHEIKRLDQSERKRLLVNSNGNGLSNLWDAWPAEWRARWSRQWGAHFERARKKYQPEKASIRHVMMHLLFPDHYEPVFSSDHKMKIVRAFNSMDPYTMSWTKIDETLRDIRAEKENELGHPIEFYHPEIRPLWMNSKLPKKPGRKPNQPEPGVPPMSKKNIFLNQIFYGPPGTGKTRHTVDATLQILKPRFYRKNETDRQALAKRFAKLKKEGRICVVTFHQSFGYEEFVEGIRPVVNKKAQQSIAYEVTDGVFKKACNAAASTRPGPLQLLRSFLSEEFKMQNSSENQEVPDAPMTIRDALSKRAYRREMRVTHGVALTGEKININHHAPRIAEVFCKKSEKNLPAEEIRKRVRKQLLTIEGATQRSSFRFGTDTVRPIDVPVSVIDKGFNSKTPFVFIIDEINRGNISRIFGELITLIEESKRVGNAEAMEVVLPYSGDTFGVPNNLYIIGTMNTADRSIALLDTALRRRFRFTEMMPDLAVLDGIKVGNINIAELLKSMNARIEALYDRDHEIGHSFFLRLKENQNIKTLAEIFQHEILPLLQEYFYDDWEKIDLVLNRNKFLEQKDPPKMPDGAVADDRKIWSIKKSELLVPANYQKIYADAADDNAA